MVIGVVDKAKTTIVLLRLAFAETAFAAKKKSH
jgi:hypothetical protein